MNCTKASIWKRIFAYLIDSLVFIIPLLIFYIIGIFRPIFWYGLDWKPIIFVLFITLIISWVYIIFKDALFDGRSIGKKVLNLQVISNEKKPCSIVKSLIRNSILIIPFVRLIELIIIVIDKDGKRLGDRLAKTKVIQNVSKPEKDKIRKHSLLFILMMFGLLITSYAISSIFGHIAYESNYDNYVYLNPADKLTLEQLSESKSIIQTRSNIHGYPILESSIENDEIILRIPNELKENTNLLYEIIQPLVFEAKIGDTVVFTGGKKDIAYVCRTADCSGINPRSSCQQVNGVWQCGFMFSISLSQQAAEKHAQVTSSLEVVREGDRVYLEAPLNLYLDDSLVETLNIAADLKGKTETQIAISGAGFGANRQEAMNDALKNMKQLQTVLITGSIPTQFTISKME